MQRVLSSGISSHIGKTATVQGWLHKKRLLGGLTFINVRDRSGVIQILIEDKKEVEKLRGLQIGTVLSVEGDVISEERAPGGVEMHEPKITVLVPVEHEPPIEIDKPLSHAPEHLDTLLDNRPIGLRNLQERAVFEIQSTACKAIRAYFEENGFTEMHTPKLLPSATEGGAEVFTLDYFGKTATLAQSPQFYKQMMVGVFERVYEIGQAYRAEPSATTRHMTEYTSVDGEMGFVTLEELKEFLSGLLNAVVDLVWKTHEPELKRWNATRPEMKAEIPTLTMAEIHELYSKQGGVSTVGEKIFALTKKSLSANMPRKSLVAKLFMSVSGQLAK